MSKLQFEKIYSYQFKYEPKENERVQGLVNKFKAKVKKNGDKVEYIDWQSREVYIDVETKMTKGQAKKVYGSDIFFNEDEE